MNTLILEWNKFIRSKLVILVLGFVFILFGSVFYKNYLDFQQVDVDKKEELFKIKQDIEHILYPQGENKVCRYSGDENKMKLLKEAYKIAEDTYTSKYRDDGKTFMQKAILFYEKIIELKENGIDIQFSKSYAEYEKNRLIEINKINGEFQYEKAPLDSALLGYNMIKYILGGIFLITLFYFFSTIYLDFTFHKGFLFTLPMNKKSFVVGKAVVSFLINGILIAIQFGACYLFGKLWKWQSNFKYPVFNESTNKFVPVKDMFVKYVGMEIAICFVALVVSVIICMLYISAKDKKRGK